MNGISTLSGWRGHGATRRNDRVRSYAQPSGDTRQDVRIDRPVATEFRRTGSPEEFGALIKADVVKWGKVVRAGNIRAD